MYSCTFNFIENFTELECLKGNGDRIDHFVNVFLAFNNSCTVLVYVDISLIFLNVISFLLGTGSSNSAPTECFGEVVGVRQRSLEEESRLPFCL